MELSAEKKFEKEKIQNYFHMNDNTKEGTNLNSYQKNSFNINEIKAYLEDNNNISNEYDPHLITDINNNFSSRKEDLFQESNKSEDLVMNQSYNYNPNLSHYSQKNQNILQISKNKNEFSNSNLVNNNNYISQSERKIFNPKIFLDISTKKSTKTSATKKEKENSNIKEPYEEIINDEDICNTFEDEQDVLNEQECKNKNESKQNESNTIKQNNDKIEKNYMEYKEYEKRIIDNEDKILEIKEDTFGKYVDNIIKRSYHAYKNRQCPSCAVLLSKGKSCIKCPKYHHLIKSGKNKI